MEIAYDNPNRHEILHKVIGLGIRTGDVLFRRSDARGPFGLPFMKIVSSLTQSKYTHAAMAFWENQTLYVLEITDIGTMKYRFIDWLCFCIDGEFAVYTCDYLEESQRLQLFECIMQVLDNDPSYDYTFDSAEKFYCTESVCIIYMAVGLRLCEPRKIKDVVGGFNYLLLAVGNWIYGKLTGGKVALPMRERFYFVGNQDNGGIMASPLLRLLVEETGN